MGYDPNKFWSGAKSVKPGVRTFGECGGHDCIGYETTVHPMAPEQVTGKGHFYGVKATLDHIVFDDCATFATTPVRSPPRTGSLHHQGQLAVACETSCRNVSVLQLSERST